ncbi:Sigma-70 family RNA polymerase sigma factor, partial [Durusdinium trenchii]
DEQAWTDLQDQYFRRIYFYIRKFVGSHQTAEDLTQDVFLGAVRGIERFDREFTLDQFLFGIARNRVIDHFRKHKLPLIPAKGDRDSDRSAIWLENMASEESPEPGHKVVTGEDSMRQREILGKILREYVGTLWQAGEFKKLMVLEYLFVLGGRNKDAAARFGIEDEKSIAGIKFRAIDKLRGLARSDPEDEALAFTVSTVWREQRVSCPHIDILRAWRDGALDADAAAFVAFHVEEAGCPYCNASIEELEAREDDAREAPMSDLRDRILRSTVSALRSQRG